MTDLKVLVVSGLIMSFFLSGSFLFIGGSYSENDVEPGEWGSLERSMNITSKLKSDLATVNNRTFTGETSESTVVISFTGALSAIRVFLDTATLNLSILSDVSSFLEYFIEGFSLIDVFMGVFILLLISLIIFLAVRGVRLG